MKLLMNLFKCGLTCCVCLMVWGCSDDTAVTNILDDADTSTGADTDSDTDTDADTDTDTDTDTDSNTDTDTDTDADTATDTDTEYEYALDDGDMDWYGMSMYDQEWWYANQFTAVEGRERIISISQYFHNVTPLTPFSVHLYEDVDDDGQPNDLVLLSSESSTVVVEEGFQEVELSTPAVVSGSFFVAVLLHHWEAYNPDLFQDDTQPIADTCWAGTATDFGTLDPVDPVGTCDGVSVQLVNTFNLMIRAKGVSP